MELTKWIVVKYVDVTSNINCTTPSTVAITTSTTLRLANSNMATPLERPDIFPIGDSLVTGLMEFHCTTLMATAILALSLLTLLSLASSLLLSLPPSPGIEDQTVFHQDKTMLILFLTDVH